MKRMFTLLVACMVAGCYTYAQVRATYEYNTAMPYGTLDIRTRISSSDYYYLQENVTFSFRESSPGVRTNKYLDMTGWESSPYTQGNLRRKTGTADKFIMNYRLLKPNGYTSTYTPGYPLIIQFHGAVERANCYYNACYHATPAYTVLANSPAAPKTATHRLLNNDHNLNVGGQQYLAARDLAGTRKPNDLSMPTRAFPGFVLIPQMFNIWDSLQVQDVVRMVRLVAAKYKIDPDRIYVQGLSIGGYAVYEAIKRAPWLFAAALPMSAVWDANIFKQNQQGKVVHIPVWTFQGGNDPRPTPAYTQNIVNKLKGAGAIVRYSLYSTYGHVVWTKAYSEPDYFSWILKQNKANVHAYKGILAIDKAKNIYPKLMLAEGFLAYQWEKDGVIQSNKTNTFTATVPGTYRARFSRISTAPTSTQWNKWSNPVKVTQVTTTTTFAATGARMETQNIEVAPEEVSMEEGLTFDVYPNPASADNIRVELQGMAESPVQVKIVDQMGRELYAQTFETPGLASAQQLALPGSAQGGVYILMVNQGQRQMRRKVVVR